MTTITIKELHARTGEWVRKAGEIGEITVTDHGHPIAVIQPIPTAPKGPPPSGNPWLHRKMSPELEALQQRFIGGPDSTEIVSEMRDGR